MWLLSGYIFIQLVLGISSQECRTSNNKDQNWYQTNKPCIFPFKNRGTGEEFNGCADIASFKNICATKVDGLGNARRIGTCGNGCPRHGSQPARSPSEPSPPKKEELTRSNYDSFRTTLKYEGAGKNSGQYLWIDDDEDNCGQAASKSQHHWKAKYIII